MVLEGEEGGKHEYCLLALEHLLERADAYSVNSEPVRWGWCRSPSSHPLHIMLLFMDNLSLLRCSRC